MNFEFMIWSWLR